MKTLKILISICISVIMLSSCKSGVKLSGSDLKSDNYWENQSHKIVKRNGKYAKMEKRYRNREERSKDNYERAMAKEKKKQKKYIASYTFDFH